MSLIDLFWIFIIFAMFQPWLAQQWMQSARVRRISALEKKRGTRVITLVHHQETMRMLGFPLVRYIDIHDSEAVIRAIHMTSKNVPIDLVLHTPGGLVLASLQIARALRAHPSQVTVFVPHYAMSGGTLIALAADRIIMSEHAVLGPIDPQLGQFPAASILRAVAAKPKEKLDDETLILADVAQKALVQLRRSAADLLQRTLAPDRAEEVSDLLSSGSWTHDYPISADEAQALGLPVDTAIPEDIHELMALYPQPRGQVAGVEYLPIFRDRRFPQKGK